MTQLADVFSNRYEIQRGIARGGMAEVYLARDQLLDRPVAVKVLFAEYARDPSFVERFRREAQSAAGLNHPNIVAIYDWGQERGTYFIVMEYVRGRSLRDVVQVNGPFSARRALEISVEAGASEIVSSDSLGIRLLARSALFHGMTQFYQELLTVRRDANEVYLLAAPEALVGREFSELSEMFMKYRSDRRSCLLIGIQRGEEMLINPIGEEAGPLQATDQLILLSRVFPSDALPLPTKPPIAAASAAKGAK